MNLKTIVADILTNSLLGSLIKRYYNNVVPFFEARINVDNKYINNRTVAQIFWKIYESAEVRFIKKYLEKDKDTVELGSSIGGVSSIIGLNKDPEAKLFCFEANSFLVPTIELNLNENGIQNHYVYNNAVGPLESDVIGFQLGVSNLTSKISSAGSSFEVPTLDLRSFIKKNFLHDYNFVCDIEGAEVYIIFEQTEVLNNCSTAIIELHETEYENKKFSIDELNSLILSRCSLYLEDHYGAVYVYKKK